jgi:hypothetical protein
MGGPGRHTSRECKCPSLSTDSPHLPKKAYAPACRRRRMNGTFAPARRSVRSVVFMVVDPLLVKGAVLSPRYLGIPRS